MNERRNHGLMHALLDRFDAWIISLVDSISEGRSNAARPTAGDRATAADSPFESSELPERRSFGGFVATGLRKVDLVRRSAAMQKRHASIRATIKETRRSIRRAPRDQRHLFSGYVRFLDDLDRRETALFKGLLHAEAHLHRYDPHALAEEVRSLERRCARADSESAEARIARSTLSARRDLLSTIEEFEGRYSAISAQLSHIAATLDLNLVRIVAVINRAQGPSAQSHEDDAYFNDRMSEMAEQLELLEESIRELDSW